MLTALQISNFKAFLRRSTPSAFQGFWARLDGSPIARRFLKGAFWSVLGSCISRALVLCSSIVAARLIGKTQYGELGIIQNTVGMFGILAGLGMGLTATKFVAEFATTDPKRTGRIIALSSSISWVTGVLLASILFFLSGWLATNTLAAPGLVGTLRISSLLLLLLGINGAQTGALAGFEMFQKIASVNLVSGMISFPLTLTGAYFGGLNGIVWAQILTQAFGCILNFTAVRAEAVRRNILISYSTAAQEFPVVWRFSIPAVLSGLVVSPVTWTCTTMLVRQPGGYGEMGTFSAANQWFSALLWLPSMLGQAILPLLSERMGAKDTKMSASLLKMAIRVNSLVTVPVILLGIFLSQKIMAAYGKEFAGNSPTLVLVLLTSGLLAIQTPVGQIIAASGKMWLGFKMNLVWGMIFLISTWILLPYGALGLAGARLLAYVGHSIWTFWYAITLFRHK